MAASLLEHVHLYLFSIWTLLEVFRVLKDKNVVAMYGRLSVLLDPPFLPESKSIANPPIPCDGLKCLEAYRSDGFSLGEHY